MIGNYHVPFWRAVGVVTPSLTLIIKNEGLRVLRLALRRSPPHRSETRQTLGTSVIAPEGYVRPKQYGRKSTTVEAVVVEGRSPHSTRFGVSVW
jgi:hypothetical protein